MNIENNSLIDNLINMSGLSEWIEKLPNGQYNLFIPKDMHSIKCILSIRIITLT